MIIDCVSDLHGHFPKLKGGDLLIIAGDLTARDTEPEYFECFDWIHEQKYRKKILIAGNHDMRMEAESYSGPCGVVLGAFEYLCDSGTKFKGIKIWGSPWTLRFKGECPNCLAYTCNTDEELAEKWARIPPDTGILITHSPPYGIRDCVENETKWGRRSEHVGSPSLRAAIAKIAPALCVFGHIHEGYGRDMTILPCDEDSSRFVDFVNASCVNERYEHVNEPIRVEM